MQNLPYFYPHVGRFRVFLIPTAFPVIISCYHFLLSPCGHNDTGEAGAAAQHFVTEGLFNLSLKCNSLSVCVCVSFVYLIYIMFDLLWF